MKKENIYVVVDTEKKAKKVKAVLEMFNQEVYENEVHYCDGYPYYHFNTTLNYFVGNDDKYCKLIAHKTKVSIKQLRNILALEHLKQGDVVVIKGGISNTEYIVKVGLIRLSDSELKLELPKSEYYRNGVKGTQSGVYGDFVRYATEEEKALFEPKQMKVGKWYSYEGYPKFLSCQIDSDRRVGFTISGLWFEANDKIETDLYKEATPEQVKEALVKEAKRRGLVCGEVLVFNGKRTGVFGTENYIFDDGCLFLNYFCIFKDGKWAEIVEKPQIKRGSRVVVVDCGETYTNHDKRKEYGVTDSNTPCLQNGTKATVYNLVTVNHIEESACIISDCGKQSLISLKGLELC